jgi:uncharacterized protein
VTKWVKNIICFTSSIDIVCIFGQIFSAIEKMDNNYIPRLISDEATASLKEFPVLTITGPRQSGKTTLVKNLFGYLPYHNLENPDIRDMITSDPRSFLRQNPEGAVIDEIQNAPELLSYIQTTVDENKSCRFVITGSNQFSMLEKASQSLAGRTVILKLLPFCMDEINTVSPGLLPDELIYNGAMPAVYADERQPARVYRNYYETYVEKDVRMLINVKDLSLFRKFMKLCAGRIGQVLNSSQLANETGASVNTIRSWISVLETSFIIHLLQPWFDNINKRLVKSPKLYFYDLGLACYLLGIGNPDQVGRDPLRGSLFENLVINEIIKKYFNCGMNAEVYFYRDKHGNEVDAVLKSGNSMIPVEIKSSETFHSDFLKGLKHFGELYPDRIEKSYLIYAGKEVMETDKQSIMHFSQTYRDIKVSVE